MKLLGCALVALSTTGAAAGLDVPAMYQECEKKHGVELPPGATPAKPLSPIRIGPQRGARTAFACVVVTVDQSGAVTDARIVESTSPAFGEYLLGLAKSTKFQPGMRDGQPFTHKVVVAAGYS